MDLKQSYFLVVGEECGDEDFDPLEEEFEAFFEQLQGEERLFELFALLLCIEENNLNTFVAISQKQKLLAKTNINIKTLNVCVYFALFTLTTKDNQSYIHAILEDIEKLFLASFVSKERFIKNKVLLKQILYLLQDKNTSQEDTAHSSEFAQKTLKIQDFITQASQIVDEEGIQEDLQQTLYDLQNQKFSIGVTGIMNSGKSTMLNALLQKEILGTALIPETANLSVLKYSQDEYAQVHFWNTTEYSQMANNNTTVNSEYIQETNVQKKIPFSSLSTYTSANAKENLSPFVKEVELFTDLNFLRFGVEIVDTPGIDDPVVVREEITKKYLSGCDVMIHLMNAAQVATKKDMDFILDALVYQNISKLIVLITHIDKIAKGEVSEVIDYVKKSMSEYFANANQSTDKLQNVIFVPIASRVALAHRLGLGDASMSIEESGILTLEDELQNLLFGKDALRANVIVQTAYTKITNSLTQFESHLNSKLTLSKLGQSSLEEKIAQNKTAATNMQVEHDKQTVQIKKELASLGETVKEFGVFFHHELSDFKNRYLNQVSGNIEHSIDTKNKIDPDDIAFMVNFSVKDGVFDALREFRFMLTKKMTHILESLQTSQIPVQALQSHKNYEDLLKDLFNQTAFFAKSYEPYVLALKEFIKKTKNKKDLSEPLQEIFDPLFASIEKHCEELMNELGASLMQSAKTHCYYPIEQESKEHSAELVTLQELLNNLDQTKKQQQEQAFHESLLQTKMLLANIAKEALWD